MINNNHSLLITILLARSVIPSFIWCDHIYGSLAVPVFFQRESIVRLNWVVLFWWNLIGLNSSTAVIQLGFSGKWPDDLCAVRRIKAAFCIKIAESLSKQFHLTVQPFPDCLHVLKVSLCQCKGHHYRNHTPLIRTTLFQWRNVFVMRPF